MAQEAIHGQQQQQQLAVTTTRTVLLRDLIPIAAVRRRQATANHSFQVLLRLKEVNSSNMVDIIITVRTAALAIQGVAAAVRQRLAAIGIGLAGQLAQHLPRLEANTIEGDRRAHSHSPDTQIPPRENNGCYFSTTSIPGGGLGKPVQKKF